MPHARAKYNLTEGGILNKMLLVALPVIGTQLMQMTYNLTDMFWLGRLSSDAVAASGIPGMYLWLSFAFILIGRMGAEIGVSQSLGRGDEEAAKRFSGNSVFLAIILGLFFGLFLILFRYPLIGFFNVQEAEVAADARLYLGIVGIGVPFTSLTSAISGAFVGSGNSRTPFLISSMGLILNMILDPITIFAMGLGIFGAAASTALIQILVCILMITAFKKDKNRPFIQHTIFVKPEKAAVRQILKWSVPIGVESFFFCGLTMIITRFQAEFGASALAAARVASQIESLSWLVGGGFGAALTAYVGQNFGAGKWGRIHQGFRLSTVVMGTYGLLITFLMYFGGGFLCSIFLSDPDIVAIGATNLRILSLCQLPMCMEAIASGSFKGIGKTLKPSVVSLTCNTLRVPLAYYLSRTSLGLNGIWIAATIGATVRGIWCFTWYMWFAYKQKKGSVVEPGNIPG